MSEAPQTESLDPVVQADASMEAADLNEKEPQADADAEMGPAEVQPPRLETEVGMGVTAQNADDEVDDDPVVKECDVYLNRMYDPPDFIGDMYVLQHPLRPIYRPYGDQGELTRVELKQKTRRLRFLYKLHHHDNYDEGGAIAEKMQEHVLTSTVVANPACSYAIGTIHKGRMVITPLRAVNQLRPDFSHLEKATRGGKATEGADFDGGAVPSSGDEDTPAAPDPLTAAPVTVNYVPAARRPRGAAANEGPPVDEEDSKEEWEVLDSYRAHTEEANDLYRKHFLWSATEAAAVEAVGGVIDHPKLQQLVLDDSKEAFLAATCMQGQARQKRREAKEKAAEEGSDGLSMYTLSRMPVESQVEAIVGHYVVCSYSQQLRRRLPPNTLRTHGTDDALLTLLRRCAVLVAGNWVLKSELAGYEGHDMLARDMLLNLFHKRQGDIKVDEHARWLESFPLVTHAAKKEITRTLVVDPQPTNGAYRIKNGADKEFIVRFPRIKEEYDGFWATKLVELRAQYSSQLKKGAGKVGKQPHSREREKKAFIIDEIQRALTERGMTLEELRLQLQKRTDQMLIRPEEIVAILESAALRAVKVRHLWVLEKTNSEANDAFRHVVFKIFRERDSVTKAEILQEYERVTKSPCRLTDLVVRGLIREVADRDRFESWVLKGTTESNN